MDSTCRVPSAAVLQAASAARLTGSSATVPFTATCKTCWIQLKGRLLLLVMRQTYAASMLLLLLPMPKAKPSGSAPGYYGSAHISVLWFMYCFLTNDSNSASC
jgi:hypothetical protein